VDSATVLLTDRLVNWLWFANYSYIEFWAHFFNALQSFDCYFILSNQWLMSWTLITITVLTKSLD